MLLPSHRVSGTGVAGLQGHLFTAILHVGPTLLSTPSPTYREPSGLAEVQTTLGHQVPGVEQVLHLTTNVGHLLAHLHTLFGGEGTWAELDACLQHFDPSAHLLKV
jgi:hypothetical protein